MPSVQFSRRGRGLNPRTWQPGTAALLGCNGGFGPITRDDHLSSLEPVYHYRAAPHCLLNATQHVVHWLGAELVAYS